MVKLFAYNFNDPTITCVGYSKSFKNSEVVVGNEAVQHLSRVLHERKMKGRTSINLPGCSVTTLKD